MRNLSPNPAPPQIPSFLRSTLARSLPRIDLLTSTLGREEDFMKDPNFRASEAAIANVKVPPSQDPVYGARYWTLPLSPRLTQIWNERGKGQLEGESRFRFRLPPPNPYIASEFALKN